jgi:hypothetical protein
MERSGKKSLLALLIFFLSFSFASSLEECPGETISPEDIPCLILYPLPGNCVSESINVFNATDLLYTQQLENYPGSQCKATFNVSQIGTYAFNFTTGDTGSIVVEENNMIDLFHVSVYAVFGVLGIIFMFMMHLFKEDNTTMVYGALSSVSWLLLAVINLSGFHLIRNVSFIVDVNFYITGLCAILALYTFTGAYFFYKENYKPKMDPYALRE